jgi:hypothetical protein
LAGVLPGEESCKDRDIAHFSFRNVQQDCQASNFATFDRMDLCPSLQRNRATLNVRINPAESNGVRSIVPASLQTKDPTELTRAAMRLPELSALSKFASQ